MFIVAKADADAIRAAFHEDGELSAAIELCRRFPGITDNAKARACARTVAGRKPVSGPTVPTIRRGPARRASNVDPMDPSRRPGPAWFRICPFWVPRDARKLPTCEGRISFGKGLVAGGGKPPGVKLAGAEAVPGPYVDGPLLARCFAVL